MIRLLMLTAACAMPTVAWGAGPFSDSARVSDDTLAGMRGGMTLPNGMQVGLGIRMDSFVDGQLVLRSVLTPGSEDGLQIYTGGSDSAQSPQSQSSSTPVVTVTTGGTGGAGPLDDGAVPLDLQPGGMAETPAGTIRVEPDNAGGAVVVLESPTLELRHLLGAATGQLIANSANNRQIDTITEINVDVQGPLPLSGSDMLRIDRTIIDAVGDIIR